MTRQIPEASLADVMKVQSRNLALNLNCHRIGFIEEFNSTEMTAKVRLCDLAIKETYVGKGWWEFPLLVDCPVVMPIRNNKGVTYPINVGDECIVLFNDRDIDNWFGAGNVSEPRTGRVHSLSDALVIVGMHSLTNPVADFNNNATEIRYDAAIVSVGDKIKIENATQNLLRVLDNLIDSLINLEVVSGAVNLPVTAATVAALETVRSEFNDLLL